MYNPYDSLQCPDANCEWIELYNNEIVQVELSGWTIDDNSFEDVVILPNEHIIVARELIDLNGGNSFEAYWGNNDSIWDSNDGDYKVVDGYFSLKNSGDAIILKDNNGEIIDSLTYSDEWGADGNGNTLEFYNGNWYESFIIGGTPGLKNSYTQNQTGIKNDCDWKIEILLDKYIFDSSEDVNWTVKVSKNDGERTDISVRGYVKDILTEWQMDYKPWTNESITNYRNQKYSPSLWENKFYLIFFNITELNCDDTNLENNFDYKFIIVLPEELSQNYTTLKINEFLPNPVGDDNAPMPNGEFIELYNNGDNDTDLTGLYFKDSANHKLYITDTRTIDGTIIESKDYLAVYMNGFSGFLNNKGFEEVRLYDPYGNLIDKVNYAGSTEALSWSLVNNVWQYRLPTPNEINPEQALKMESSFKIEKLEDISSDNESEFGDIIKVKFHVYKGNTTKSSIKLYIENDAHRITKITKAKLHDKFTNYSLTLPIQIKPNCNEKYKDGDYYVKIGWTSSSKAEDTFKIRVEGIDMNNCDKIYVERKPRKGTLEHSLIEAPGAVEINKDFTVKVELTNNDGEDHVVDLYSYVYRGPKSYSGEKDSNKKSVLVKATQTKEFELKNIVRGAEPGDYKLKINVKRDDQKTEKEITQAIKVFQEKGEEEIKEKQEKIELKEKDKEDYTLLESTKQPKIIYESPSTKAKKLVVYLFIGLLIIYATILTWKR